MNDLHYLLLSTALAWLMLVLASMLRARGWTPAGMQVTFGNRDQLPDISPLAARGDRAAKNMLENLLLFVCALAAARLAGADPQQVTTGAALFFWARVVYAALYLAGIAYVRTMVWLLSVAGIAWIMVAAFARL